MKLKIFCIIFFNFIFIFLNNRGIAQTHTNFWSRFTIDKSFSSKIKFDVEFQYRQQNGFGNNNLFSEPLLYSLRTWFIYQPKNELQFSISPLAYFYHFPIINKASDATKPFLNEYRVSFAMDNKIANFKKYIFQNRVGLEYRIFQPTIKNGIRFREKVGLKYDFSYKWNVFLYDEMLLNLYGVNNNHLFDHNRLGLHTAYKFTKNIKIEAGYIFITRLQRTATEVMEDNNFILNCTYLLQNKK